MAARTVPSGNRFALLASESESEIQDRDQKPRGDAVSQASNTNTSKKLRRKKRKRGADEEGPGGGAREEREVPTRVEEVRKGKRVRAAEDAEEGAEAAGHGEGPAAAATACSGATGAQGLGGPGDGADSSRSATAAGAGAGDSAGEPAHPARKTLRGGVVVDVLREAPPSAATAKAGDVVKLLYEGRLPANGNKCFDKGDVDFVLGGGHMILGFDAGVAGMRVGEQRRIYVPAKLGYGKKGKKPKVPPNSDLSFTVVLIQAGVDWSAADRGSAVSGSRREAMRRRRKKGRIS